MTTSNKNFKVKNGLEVLGSFATVNGNAILSTASVLDALANVDTNGITDGQTIIYDEATLTFIPGDATGGGASITVSDTAPSTPTPNELWYNSSNGGLFIRLVDIDSEQWVQIGIVGPQGLQGEQGPAGDTAILIQGVEPEVTDVLWFDTSVDGEGVPLGGEAGQVLAKVDSTDFNTEWVSPLSQSDIDTALEDYYTGAQIDTALGNYYTAAQIDTTLQDYYTVAQSDDDFNQVIQIFGDYYTSAQIDTTLQNYPTSTELDTTLQDYYTISQTDSAISTAVSSVVDTAPEMLDTLNELSAALNDDPNFATTVADALAALVPSGTINQTARATAPTGYLLCDGSAISRVTYSNLFDAIGTAYGAGDGSTTFNIPNLKGKVPVGYDSSQSEFDTLGETGGAKTHTLTIDQMPSHTHVQNSHNHTQNSHNHSQNAHSHLSTINTGLVNSRTAGFNTYNSDGGADKSGGIGATTATNNPTTATNNATTATNQSTGGGAAHNNLQPYVVLNYMIKI